jgi:hypothetical protein
LVHLADDLSFLNGLNLSVEGKSVNVFKDKDQTEAAMKKTGLWSRQMSNNESGYLIVSELWLSDKIKYGIYN